MGFLVMRIYIKVCFNLDVCLDVGVFYVIFVFCVFLKFIIVGFILKF